MVLDNSKQQETVNIGYSGSSGDFLVKNGLYESVFSLLSHTKSDIYIYILIPDPENQIIVKFLQKIQNDFRNLKGYSIDKPDLPDREMWDFPIVEKSWGWHKRYEKCDVQYLEASRLMFPAQCKVSRLLFLGADTLFLDDVAKIYFIDLKSKIIAAAKDVAMHIPILRELNNPPFVGKIEDDYFMCDFQIFNCDEYRRQNIFEKSIADIRKNIHSRLFYDQDSLNVLLENSKIILDQKWNLVPKYAKNIKYIFNTSMIHFSEPKVYKTLKHGFTDNLKSNFIFGLLFSLIRRNLSPYFVGKYIQVRKKLIKLGYYSL